MKKFLGRRIKRFLRKPKFLRAKKEILEFQKFSAIYFIGNSQASSDDKQELAELFKITVSLAYKYFQKFLNWLLSWFPKVSAPIIALFRNHGSYILFGVGISLALLIFHEQLKRTSNLIMAWLKKKFKWPAVGCLVIVVLVIYLLLMAVTDLPSLPVTKSIRDLISKVSAIFQSSSELSPKKPVRMTNEPKYNGEKNKLIFLSVITVLFLRYLLVRYKRKLFKYIPFGEILIEMYDNDMENSPNSFVS